MTDAYRAAVEAMSEPALCSEVERLWRLLHTTRLTKAMRTEIEGRFLYARRRRDEMRQVGTR